MNVQTFTLSKDQQSEIPAFPVQNPEKTLMIMFGDSALYESPELIQCVSQAYPGTAMMGCSTSGEIFGTHVSDESLAVGLLEFEQTTFKCAAAPVGAAEDSFRAGENIGHTLNEPDLQGVIVFSDGLKVNGSELVRGLNAVLPDNVVVTGGLAGDRDRFERTWVIHEGRPQSGFVTAIGFYGDAIRIGHGSKGGWDIFGPRTSSDEVDRKCLV